MTFFNPFFPYFPHYFPHNQQKQFIEENQMLDAPADVNRAFKKPIRLDFLDIFNETDNLIIIALLLFLYKQNTYKSPLAICLLMLLFDL